MNKAISLTLGVVVCSLISAQCGAANAAGVATGPTMLAPAIAPAGTAGGAGVAVGPGGFMTTGVSNSANTTAAAGAFAVPTTIVPVSSGGGASFGTEETAGTAFGQNAMFSPGASFGAGNSTGPATGLTLRGTVSNMANNGFTTMGRLASNPNLTLAQNAAGQFFIVSPNGQLQILPQGTNIAGLLGSSITASLTSVQQAALFNPFAAPFTSTPMTLVHTTNDGNVAAAIATRSVFTNGFPTSVSGQIIAEYPRTKVESFARVYPKKSAKRACRHNCGTHRKQSRVYLRK